eukprot:10103403-Lingulodinium_polyedra.AAC.1
MVAKTFGTGTSVRKRRRHVCKCIYLLFASASACVYLSAKRGADNGRAMKETLCGENRSSTTRPVTRG